MIPSISLYKSLFVGVIEKVRILSVMESSSKKLIDDGETGDDALV